MKLEILLFILLGSLILINAHDPTCHEYAFTQAKLDKYGKPGLSIIPLTINDPKVPDKKTTFNFKQMNSKNFNGKGTMTGTLVSTDDSSTSYELYVPFVPSESIPPVIELKDEAYAKNGGPVEPANWDYYKMDGNNSYIKGPKYMIRLLVDPDRPSIQTGPGASNRNVGIGGYMTFKVVYEDVKTREKVYESSAIGELRYSFACQDCTFQQYMASDGAKPSLQVHDGSNLEPFGGHNKFSINRGAVSVAANGDLLFNGVFSPWNAANDKSNKKSIRKNGVENYILPVPNPSSILVCSIQFHRMEHPLESSLHSETGADPTLWRYYYTDPSNFIGCTLNNNNIIISGNMNKTVVFGKGVGVRRDMYGLSASFNYQSILSNYTFTPEKITPGFDLNVDLSCLYSNNIVR
eukprot:gene7385-9072_t